MAKKMLIPLDEDFRMTSDPRNLVLEKRSEIESKEDESIKEIWSNVGYYPSIKSLLYGYVKKSVMSSSVASLEELSEDIKRIENKIDKFIGGQINE